jgi:hypothetical protein
MDKIVRFVKLNHCLIVGVTHMHLIHLPEHYKADILPFDVDYVVHVEANGIIKKIWCC